MNKIFFINCYRGPQYPKHPPTNSKKPKLTEPMVKKTALFYAATYDYVSFTTVFSEAVKNTYKPGMKFDSLLPKLLKLKIPYYDISIKLT